MATQKKQQQRMRLSVNKEPGHGRRDRSPSAAGEEKEEWIGRQLREVYDEALNEPIPERFLELLKQIDRKQGS